MLFFRTLRHPWIPPAPAIAGLTLAALLTGAPAAALADEWDSVLVIKVEGKVWTRNNDASPFSQVWQSRLVLAGGSLKTGPGSWAKIRYADQRLIDVGENTFLKILRREPGAQPVDLDLVCGTIRKRAGRFLGADSEYVETPNLGGAPRGTEFAVGARQKIAYVDGGDLWLMNHDGTGRTNYIAAPAGQRIGRSAFSPDGARVVYEVWTTNSAADGPFPTTSDLWLANVDGSNPQLLCDAGATNESTGLAPFVYRHRLLLGPSFSPDGTRISCLRLQVYSRPVGPPNSAYVLVKEVGTISLATGIFEPWWESAELLDPWWSGAQTPLEFYAFRHLGENTAWNPENSRIAFSRSGAGKTMFSWLANAAAAGTNRWPVELAVGWSHEGGRAPVKLRCSLAGEALDLLPRLRGYGVCMPVSGSSLTWYGHPEGVWQAPGGGAWYGVVTTWLAAGTYDLEVEWADGAQTISVATNLQVKAGAVEIGSRRTTHDGAARSSGIWTIGAGGGEPTRLVAPPIGSASVAWNGAGDQLAVNSHSDGAGLTVYFHDANGILLRQTYVGGGQAHSVGNWDATDSRLVVWSGTNAEGRIRIVEAGDTNVCDLGPGAFPIFAPLFETSLDCFQGLVAVSDLNRTTEQLCSAGQSTTCNDLGPTPGIPAPATAIAGPHVVRVSPTPGAAVPDTAPPAVTWNFSAPVDADSFLGRTVNLVNWAAGRNADFQTWTLYASALNGTNPLQSVRPTVSQLVASGLAAGVWSRTNTQFQLTFTNGLMTQTTGRWGGVDIDLSGLQTTGGVPVACDSGETWFRFVPPIGSDGGEIADQHGGRMIVPPGALADDVAFETAWHGSALEDWPVPDTNAWTPAGGFYVFSPADAPLSTAVEICLPWIDDGTAAEIWRCDGTNWLSVGGTPEPDVDRICATVAQPGIYAMFQPHQAGPWLVPTLEASRTTVTNGEIVEFRLRVRNAGGNAATNVVAATFLPTALVCLTNSIGSDGFYDPGEHAVSWLPFDLAPDTGTSAVYSAAIAADAPYGSIITNIPMALSDIQTATGLSVNLTVGLPVPPVPRFGVGTTNSTDAENLDALGATWRRLPVVLTTGQVANADAIDFTPYDAAVRSNQLLGLRVFGSLDCLGASNAWPVAAALADTAGRFVERYDGDGRDDMADLQEPVLQWELFPYHLQSSHYAGLTDALYADYLSAMHGAAHAASPEVSMFSGSKYGSRLAALLNAHPGARDAIDGVSVQNATEATPYGSGDAPTCQYLQSRSIRDDLAAAGLTNVEVWMTSACFGGTYVANGFTNSQADNALFLARSLPAAFAAGIDRLFYYELEERPSYSFIDNWNVLVDSNGARRLNFHVYRKMIEKLEGFSAAYRLDPGPTNRCAKFIVAGAPVWVLWNASNRSDTVALPVGPVAEVRVTKALPDSHDATNAVWSVVTNAVAKGIAHLPIDGVPVYVELAAPYAPDLDGDGLANDEDDDLDGDGLPNDYETANGLDPYVHDAGADPDGDGHSNSEEHLLGTDPQDSASALACETVARPSPSEIQLGWQSVSGKTYRVEYSPAITGIWQIVADGTLSATGSLSGWTDSGPPRTTTPPAGNPRRYYRVRAVLP